MTTRRVLVIAPYFPPRRRVGSLRPFRFATHLRALGWQPTVVCLATPGEALSERESSLSAGVDRIELAAPFDRTRRHASGDFGAAGSGRAAAGPAGPAAAVPGTFAGTLPALLSGAVDSWVPLDTWAPLLAYHAVQLMPRLKAIPFSMVFSTADPWSSHLFGGWAARALGVPWVADFRDPFTLCPIRGRGPVPTRALNRAFERRVLDQADHVTFTTERTLARYQAAYPGAARRMSYLPNGFDASALADPVDGELPVLEPGEPLRLCFFGRFRPLSPAHAIVLALWRLREREPELAARMRVCSVGALPEADAALARELGVAHLFEPLPAVPYEHMLRVVRQHDISLLSAAPERDDIVPAKLWDYLAARRPILALGTNPDVGQLLTRLSAGVQLAPDDTPAVTELLERCILSKQRGEALPVPARPLEPALPELEATQLTRRLAAIFEALAATPARRAS